MGNLRRYNRIRKSLLKIKIKEQLVFKFVMEEENKKIRTSKNRQDTILQK